MYPPIFITFLQISTTYLLPPKLSTLQIKMMDRVLVVAKIALLSFEVVHVPNKEVGVLPTTRVDF
jgi:hypothetical protein